MADPDASDPLRTVPWSGPLIGSPPVIGDSSISDSELEALFAAGQGPSYGWHPPAPEKLQHDFPQYEIRAVLGRGGMGAVYKAWQKSLHRFVAIKILPPILGGLEGTFAERFQREAQTMARLRHPGIVSVYDAGTTPGGLLYFTMEYIEGTDLQRLVDAQGRLPAAQALGIAARVCEALECAHELGIIHRDIKPSNIIIDRDGNVKVADFGLARPVTAESGLLTRSNVVLGTPEFMAPEALRVGAHIDQRADLFAVGVMLYRMLTGDFPRGRFTPVSRAIPGLDRRLDRIVDRALQGDCTKRYSHATEMRADLERFAMVRTPRPSRYAVGAVAIAGLLVGALLLVLHWRRNAPVTTASMAPRSVVPVLSREAPPVVNLSWPAAPHHEPIINSLGMKFVFVPGTTVFFCIHDTRCSDYAAFAAENPGTNDTWRHPTRNESPVDTGPSYPVVQVSWDEANSFCRWLSRKENRTYRLPTDREWSSAVGIAPWEDEHTAPGSKTGKLRGLYPWGRQWPPPPGAGNFADVTAEQKFHWDKMLPDYTDGYATTSPVMSFAPNPLGLYDMAGNVFQWCADWYDAQEIKKVARGSSFENGPYGRPGHWDREPYGDVLACTRMAAPPNIRPGSFGFRVALEQDR